MRNAWPALVALLTASLLALPGLTPSARAEDPVDPGNDATPWHDASSLICEPDEASLPVRSTEPGASEPLNPVAQEPLDLPLGPIETLSPGTDTSLGMRWEPTIAVDPNNPQTVAVAQGATVQISLDGGDTFTQVVTGATPMTCDDGMTACFSNADCAGIGTGICYTGQCQDGLTYCNATSDCSALPGMAACGGLFGGDPSLAFDSQGRLALTYLCRLPNAGRDVCITTFEQDPVSLQFAAMDGGLNWPIRATVAAGLGGQNADKEWLAGNSFPGTPFQDRLYLVWTDLNGANNWEMWTSFSSDQGQNWSPGLRLSPVDGSEGRVWASHNTVAPNGDVYVAYHSQTGFVANTGSRVPDGQSGQVFVARSNTGGQTYSTCDGGAIPCTRTQDCVAAVGPASVCTGKSLAYDPGEADTSWNVQHFQFCDDGSTLCTSNANCAGIGSGTCNPPVGVIAGAMHWQQGNVQPWVLADPTTIGQIYVVAADATAGDPSSVFIVRSDDFGATWTDPNQVDNGPAGTFQLMPNAAIDPVTGAIAVTYYSNSAASVNPGGNFRLDLLATYSSDGGNAWSPEVDFNDGLFDPDLEGTPSPRISCRFCGASGPTNVRCGGMACMAAGGPNTTRIGEYNGVAFGECTAHVVWADNALPGGGDMDTYYDNDPEAGGDFEPPAVACPENQVIACTESTDPSNTGTATATDNCVVDPEVVFADDVTPGECPQEMTIERIWSSTDRAGNTDSCSQTISVVDLVAPTVTVPEPISLECNAPGGVPATDPDIVDWLGMATAVDDCGLATLTDNAPDLFPASCPPGVPTDVVFTGIDECGNSNFDVSSVTVLDTTDPMITCEVSTTELWPPNHKLVDVGFTINATDVCDDDLDIVVSVTSDEDPYKAKGAGGPKHCPDAVTQEDNSVLIRAERSGGGNGRVYVISATATDECGNVSACEVTVGVPKNQGGQSVPVDSGQDFDPTDCGGALLCEAPGGTAMKIMGETLATPTTLEACERIELAGTRLSSQIEIRSGDAVVFSNGFSVDSDATLTVEIDTSLDPATLPGGGNR